MNILTLFEKLHKIKLKWWQRLYLKYFYIIGYCFSKEVRREVQFIKFLGKLYKHNKT
jgi:hypothetical protein